MPNSEKKVPMRMCIICREMYEKKQLIRIVKSAEGVFIDLTGKKNGRGVYICKNIECHQKCKKHKGFKQLVGENDFLRVIEELDCIDKN